MGHNNLSDCAGCERSSGFTGLINCISNPTKQPNRLKYVPIHQVIGSIGLVRLGLIIIESFRLQFIIIIYFLFVSLIRPLYFRSSYFQIVVVRCVQVLLTLVIILFHFRNSHDTRASITPSSQNFQSVEQGHDHAITDKPSGSTFLNSDRRKKVKNL